MQTSIAIVADFNNSKSHRATTDALAHSSAALGIAVAPQWISTTEFARPGGPDRLSQFSGVWIGPGSPYASMEGALAAIRFAREREIPVLGTCGGFQHIVIEYARNVLQIADAEHEETAPEASRLVISRLACSLAGRAMTLTLKAGSRLAQVYGRTTVEEEYLCNFGVNPEYVNALCSGALQATASDAEGLVRGVELPGHPFFVGTLFLPQHRSQERTPHSLVSAFVRACAGRS
jgi:CTP synthase (UTP-ammonia lyase)